MMAYIKEVIDGMLHLYKYYTFNGKLVLTYVAVLSIFDVVVRKIYENTESHISTQIENLRRRMPYLIKKR